MTTKILNASIINGEIVTGSVEKISVPDAVKFCLGEADSTGKLIITEDCAFYIANTHQDVRNLLEQVSKITEICSQIAGTSPAQGSPLNPNAKAELKKIKTELDKVLLV